MVEIPLANGKGVALIDDCDAERVLACRWHLLTSRGYVAGTVRGRKALLHRFVLGAAPHSYVDHINHDRLDCRRANLRECTAAENMRNRMANRRGASRFLGVTRIATAKRRPWRAGLTIGETHYNLGRYDAEEDAARAFDAAVRARFSGIYRVNFPQEGELCALHEPPNKAA